MSKWLLCLLSALLLSSHAHAEMAEMDEAEKRKRGERWFKSYDADFDGFISRQEYLDVEMKKAEKRFQFIDSTKDGYISGAEAKTAKEKRDKMLRKGTTANSQNKEKSAE